MFFIYKTKNTYKTTRITSNSLICVFRLNLTHEEKANYACALCSVLCALCSVLCALKIILSVILRVNSLSI